MQQRALESTVLSRVEIFARSTWARWTGTWEDRGERPIPTYRPGARLTNWLEFRKDVLGVFTRARTDHGDLVRLPVMYNDIYLVHDAEVLRDILIDHPGEYGRGISHVMLRRIVGEGMLTSETAPWIEQRRAAAPAFSTAGLRPVEGIAEEIADAWIARWDDDARRGAVRPLALDLMGLTAQVTVKHFFGAALAMDRAVQFVDDFVRVQALAFRRLTDPWALDFRAGPALARIRQLSTSLAAASSRPELASQAMTVLATAPENPSNTLAWTLYLLARHPEVDRQVAAAIAGGDEAYLAAVLHESLRLYPGAWSFERTALRDRVVAGYHLPAGAMLMFSPYTLHRCPRRWPEPEVFRPERFLDRSPRDLAPFTFMPFSAGPRRCVGDRFTIAVVTAVLRKFVARFRLELDARERGEPWPMFTLRPRTNILARLVRR